MAFSKFRDRVQMTVSGTPGTGNVTLGSATSLYRSAAAAGAVDGEYNTWLFQDGNAWEVSRCVYSASGTSLARTLIASSSGSLLSLSSGTICSIDADAASVQAPGFLAGKLLGANFNSTGDQAIALQGSRLWTISDIWIVNPSGAMSNAQGTFYAGAGRTNAIVGGGTSSLVQIVGPSSTVRICPGDNSTGTPTPAFNHAYFNTYLQTIYFNLTTGQGAPATGDIYVYGLNLDL